MAVAEAGEKKESRPRPNPRALWRFLRMQTAYAPQFVALMLLSLVLSALGLAIPVLKQIGIDEGIGARNLPRLMQIVWLSFGVIVVQVVAGYAQAYFACWLGQAAIHGLRTRLFAHLEGLSLSFYDRFGHGEIISRMINDLDAANQLVTSGLSALLADLVTLVAISVILFAYDWRLALAVHAVLPLTILVATVMGPRMHRSWMSTRETLAQITTRLNETVHGIRVVRGFAQRPRFLREFDALNEANQEANIRAAKAFGAFLPPIEMCMTLGVAIVFGYGGWLIYRQEMRVGVALAFVMLLQRQFEPIFRLSEFFATVQRALVGLERAFEILDTPVDVADPAEPRALGPVQTVVFDEVSFSYDGRRPVGDSTGDPPPEVLREIFIEARRGDSIALVGPTGAGKSTIVKLLARHYDPKTGAVRVNATDIRHVALESLRGQMAIVQQETHLFSGTIRDNIRYGRPDATEDQVIEAARVANAHEFIADLPRGYDTDVQERGLRLSNGQRQLISFARAVLVSPTMLILDEATSSVDPLTEKRIRDALRVLLHDRIAFIIAHRLSTVSESSQILVIDEGRVVDRGRHSELMGRCDLYRSLYHRRFREDDTEQALVPVPAAEGSPRTEP